MLRAALEGDGTAVAGLYDRHASTLYRLAACLVGPEAAEDVVVDVLVEACTRHGALDPTAQVRSQLVGLVDRECRAHPARRCP